VAAASAAGCRSILVLSGRTLGRSSLCWAPRLPFTSAWSDLSWPCATATWPAPIAGSRARAGRNQPWTAPGPWRLHTRSSPDARQPYPDPPPISRSIAMPGA
jgi:hypothetical protein